jgi:hypothetical protein
MTGKHSFDELLARRWRDDVTRLGGLRYALTTERV